MKPFVPWLSFNISLALFVAAVTAQAQPVITQQPASQVATNGGTAVFSVAVSGTEPFSYQWQLNGTNLNTISTAAIHGPSIPGATPASPMLWQPNAVAVDNAGDVLIADGYDQIVLSEDANGIITVIAGVYGNYGYSGDGGPATDAAMENPYGIAVDVAGNLFIADSANSRVRKVDTNGIITTVAGNGTGGYFGDGGVATNAELYYPFSVALNGAGNLFIADSANFRARKVNTSGIISTVAGNGTNGYSGDGGPGINAELYNVSGVGVDSAGSLLIADTWNYRIRKVDANGIITTLAGNGKRGYFGDGGWATNAEFFNPVSVVEDGSGNLFVADEGNNCIRKVDASGIVTTVAGNGSPGYSGDGGIATKANLNTPSSVALDGAGNLFIADLWNNAVRKVCMANQPTLTITNVSTNLLANLYSVIISCPSGSITSSVATLNMPPFITAHPVDQTIPVSGSASFNVAVGGTGPFGFQWTLNGVALDGATNSSYVVTNASTDAAGAYAVTVTNQFGGATSHSAALGFVVISQQPTSQVVTNGGTSVFNVLVSAPVPVTYRWQFDGTNLPVSGIITTVAGNRTIGYSGDGGPATNGALDLPSGVTVDAAGNFFIADSGNHRIRKVDTNGVIRTAAGNGGAGYGGDGGTATKTDLDSPRGVAVDGAGDLFIADTYNHRIRKVDTNGIIATVAGNGSLGYYGDGGLATGTGLAYPFGVAVDGAGNLFIADTYNHRIRKVDTNGIITTIAGIGVAGYRGDAAAATNAELQDPEGLALDRAGNLFIADTYNHRIRKVDTNGIITTIAGNGAAGYSGDGSAATNAQLSYPGGVTVDGAGNLFIADSSNGRIRKVDTNGIITTVAGNGNPGSSGDGSSATEAELYLPSGVAVDGAGNLFIADDYNHLIRRVAPFHSYLPTLPQLMVTNVSGANLGNYSVVITWPGGSITSSLAVLTNNLPPPVLAAARTTGGLQLAVTGIPAYSYVLQTATNLTPPIPWQPVITNFTDTNGNWICPLTNTGTAPRQFYRVLAQ